MGLGRSKVLSNYGGLYKKLNNSLETYWIAVFLSFPLEDEWNVKAIVERLQSNEVFID